MENRVAITEYLEVDVQREMWVCRNCGREIISAAENYKKGCLVYERDPREIHRPRINAAYDFSPDPQWCAYLEFYCPGCGTMIEVEALAPGHPVTHDIELNLAKLKEGLG